MKMAQCQQSYTKKQKQQLAALKRAHKLRQEIRLQNNETLNQLNVVDLLNEMRDERDAELLRLLANKPDYTSSLDPSEE